MSNSPGLQSPGWNDAMDDIFFGIVQRGAATIILKAIGVEPVPTYTRDIKQVLHTRIVNR